MSWGRGAAPATAQGLGWALLRLLSRVCQENPGAISSKKMPSHTVPPMKTYGAVTPGSGCGVQWDVWRRSEPGPSVVVLRGGF